MPRESHCREPVNGLLDELEMTPGERWLATLWPLVRARLPAPPARVVDIGCGPLGGFVPMLRAEGYDAVGIDPQAPEQPPYRRIEFERAELPLQVDAVVASTSLHHVADPADVIDRISSTLTSSGAVVIVENVVRQLGLKQHQLGRVLNKMGARVEGAGTSVITVESTSG